MDFNEESIQKLNGLAMAVLNKSAKDLTRDSLLNLLKLDIDSLPAEITINTSDTRKTEVQYCTNTYGGSVRLVFNDMKQTIREQLQNIQSIDEMLNKYLELKTMYLNFVKFKYESMEKMLRDLSREAQIKDRIVPVGRFNQ